MKKEEIVKMNYKEFCDYVEENMIRKEVREMPPSGIRKYFDIVNEMEGVAQERVTDPSTATVLSFVPSEKVIFPS